MAAGSGVDPDVSEPDGAETADSMAGGSEVAPGTDSPWLNEDQQRVWRSFLSMSRLLDDRVERDMQQHGGMPFAYYLVLAMLSEAPDRRLRMNKLSELVNFSQSRLSHAINRITEFGWVRREAAEGDRRGQLAVLTDAGHAKLLEVAPLHADTVRSTLFDPLSPAQLVAFEGVIEQVLTAHSALRYDVPEAPDT